MASNVTRDHHRWTRDITSSPLSINLDNTTAASLTINSGGASAPRLILQGLSQETNACPLLIFATQRDADTAGQDGDVLGGLTFNGYNDGSVSGTPAVHTFAHIKTEIDVVIEDQESGKLSLQVASHDGGLEDGLVLTGGSVDAEVDVAIGNGAASITAVAGNITVGGTVDGVDIAVRDALHNFTYHYVVANFNSSSSSTAFFVPLVGGVFDVATPGSGKGESFGMIAPHNGTLEKVMLRSENRMRFDFLCELLTASNDTEIPNTVVGTLNGDFDTSVVNAHNTYTYDWTGTLTSGANTFSAGQVLAVRIDPTSMNLGDAYCMCVFKYDITT
tara:strand:- start:693 stop:1688 length:996 start_codon:yes stop_codon:yes gene_type:complete